MTTRRRPVSLILSYVACIACLVAIIPVSIVLPGTAATYLSEHEPALMEHFSYLLFIYYLCISIATAVLILLLLLLRVVERGAVFTPVSGRLVFAIALLVIAEGGSIALLGVVYPPALAVTVVAVTMGLCFLVVSHVLREAARLKEENDATI